MGEGLEYYTLSDPLYKNLLNNPEFIEIVQKGKYKKRKYVELF